MPAVDDYASFSKGLTSPAIGHETVSGTTAGAVDLVHTSRAIWVGGAGNVVCNLAASTANPATFLSVAAGTMLPIRVTGFTTACTATGIVALY